MLQHEHNLIELWALTCLNFKIISIDRLPKQL